MSAKKHATPRRPATHLTRGLLVMAMSALVVGSIAGCSGHPAAPSASASAGTVSKQQTEALKDGTITWDEYQTAFTAYEKCLSEAGYALTNLRIVDDLMDFGVPAAAVDSGADDKCYAAHWSDVDGAWQIAHLNTSPSAKIVANCLQANGVTPQAKYLDNLELLKKHGIAIADCPVIDG